MSVWGEALGETPYLSENDDTEGDIAFTVKLKGHQPNPAEPEPRGLPGLQTPGPRSGLPRRRFFLEPGVWSPGSGARGLEPGVWSLEPGVFATLRKISRRRDYRGAFPGRRDVSVRAALMRQ